MTREQTFLLVARKLRDGKLSEQMAYNLMMQHYADRNEPPMSSVECAEALEAVYHAD
jgi:hypothetical protein